MQVRVLPLLMGVINDWIRHILHHNIRFDLLRQTTKKIINII